MPNETVKTTAPRRPTDRQLDILELVASGYEDSEIADELGIAAATVKNTLTNIRERMHVKNRTHAVALCLKHGWLVFPPDVLPEETNRLRVFHLRELHGELGLVPFDALTPDDRERIGGVLDGLWQLAQEMEGDSDAPR